MTQSWKGTGLLILFVFSFIVAFYLLYTAQNGSSMAVDSVPPADGFPVTGVSDADERQSDKRPDYSRLPDEELTRQAAKIIAEADAVVTSLPADLVAEMPVADEVEKIEQDSKTLIEEIERLPLPADQ